MSTGAVTRVLTAPAIVLDLYKNKTQVNTVITDSGNRWTHFRATRREIIC